MDQDECWFSRFAQPRLHSWAAKGEELRLVQRQPQPQEPDKALACFGAVRQDNGQRYLFFADGQPDTRRTILMLKQLLEVARSERKRVLAIIWDRASWHKSRELKQWQRQWNRTAKREGGVRLLTCLLPVQSPWLNPMEPHWLHAKRAIVEPDGELVVAETKRRLCAHFQVSLETATLQ